MRASCLNAQAVRIGQVEAILANLAIVFAKVKEAGLEGLQTAKAKIIRII